MSSINVLIVDLNNFAQYPTLSVGYLAAILRKSNIGVTVFSPLALGILGVPREPPETRPRDVARRINYLLANNNDFLSKGLKRLVDGTRNRWLSKTSLRIVGAFDHLELAKFDAILISTYLMYHDACSEIGKRCKIANVPLLIGGPYFNNRSVAREWLKMPGLTALIAGEVETDLVEIVRELATRNDLSRFSGALLPDGRGNVRAPLADLDSVPFPDYRDFPWTAYPRKIIPIITGRGCGWGVCGFCSDVTSSAGRTYRSRSPENVLAEIQHQSRRYSASLFAFTDLKLNSNLNMWDALVGLSLWDKPNIAWICAVHVGSAQSNGLERANLLSAKRAGLARLTTGLESGSQRVLDTMKKGTDLGETSRFLIDAYSAGISVRVTMIHGYPGETASDVRASADYLERHQKVIDRVLLNRFQIIDGPAFARQYQADPTRFPDVRIVKTDPAMALVSHEYAPARRWDYVRATQRLLSAVHQINRKKLSQSAAQFEGVL